MIHKSIRLLLPIVAVWLTACGSIATPAWMVTPSATPNPAEVAARATQVPSTEVPTETLVPPTATPVPPTETPLPPTEAPTETPVPPTEAPTEAESAGVEGDPAAGQTLFQAGANGAIPCSTCHRVDSDQTLVGPGLLGLPERAGERVPGEDAIIYIHQSIVDPNAFIVPNFPPGVMPPNYGQIYTEDQLNDLIAYLMTLHAQ